MLKYRPYSVNDMNEGNVINNGHNGNNSPLAINGTIQTTDDKQNKLMLKMMDSIITLNERVTKLIQEKCK